MLDGKPQGSRTWLLNTLVRAIPRSPDVHWIIYCRDDSSFDPFRGFANAERRGIPFGSSLLRLGIFWPWVLWRGGVHATLFQYHGPQFFGSARYWSFTTSFLKLIQSSFLGPCAGDFASWSVLRWPGQQGC